MHADSLSSSSGWQRDAVAVAEALFWSGTAPVPPDRLAWLASDLEHFLTSVGGRSHLVFRAALSALTLAAPLAVLEARPLHRLPLDKRVQALERLEKTPLGMAVFAVKTLLCFLWYEHPDNAVEVGLVKNVMPLSRYRGAGPRR